MKPLILIAAAILAGLGAAPLLAQPPAQACHAPPAPGEVVLQEGRITLTTSDARNPQFHVAAIATKHEGRAQAFGVSDVDLYVWDERCTLVYRHTYLNTPLVRFEAARLGRLDLLHVVAMYVGGSGDSFGHEILDASRLDDPQPLAPMRLVHSNMGGLFVGALGPGRGDGIALWEADWDDGGHYDPHPQDMWLYRWDDGRFTGPEHLRTAAPVPATHDAAPTALGLPFRDSTGRDAGFYSIDRLIEVPSVP